MLFRVNAVALLAALSCAVLPVVVGGAEPASGGSARAATQATGELTLDQLQERLREVREQHGEHARARIGALLDISWLLASQERFAEGIAYLEQARTVAARNHELSAAEDKELVRRLCLVKAHYANWLGSLGEYRHARRFLDEAERDLAQAFGEDHPLLIAPLVSRAFLYGGRSYKLKERGRALTRAIEIAWRSDEVAPREIVELYAREGDFYIVNDQPERAWRSYRRAWRLWAEDASGDAQAESPFAAPRILYRSPYVLVARRPTGGAGQTIEIEGEVSIGRDGRIKSVRILTPDIDTSIARSATRILFNSRYRPAMRAGKVVEVPSHRTKGEFRLTLSP